MTDTNEILDLLDGFCKSKAMFAAVELGIFDGQRPASPELPRLLEACASLGLLEPRGDAFVNTALADRYLRTDSPQTLVGYIRFLNRDTWERWGKLEEHLEPHPGLLRRWWRRRRRPEAADFPSGMHGLGQITSPWVAAAFDLSTFDSFVDLGGSTGHLALAMLARYPHMQATLFDLPHVIALADHWTHGKLTLQAGDYHEDPLPRASLYGLGKVLHNERDPDAVTLLRQVHAALPDAGAVLIAERILNENHSGPPRAALSTLNMLVTGRGRERTASEYAALLKAAGFAEPQVARSGVLLDAILARRL